MHPFPTTSDADAIEALNRDCFCVSLDNAALRRELEAQLGSRSLRAPVLDSHPHLFAALPVFVSRHHVDRMAAIIDAIESVVATPQYRAFVMGWAPEIAQFDPGARGVFLGYDFHVGAAGPKVIEINTNAGGALLNVVLGRAQRACCKAIAHLVPSAEALAKLEADIVAMFVEEWRLQRGSRPLRLVAVVDDAPPEQYLYPEFLLFQQLFHRHGIEALVVAPEELRADAGGVWLGSARVDLVYNRLTDFALELPLHAPLRNAYLKDEVVLTPHPRAHALYADKRNLAVLTDEARLREWRIPGAVIQTLLAGIPRTERVDTANAEGLWANRRKLFFKPAGGFGSRAAYRGDKLTRRVWQEVLAGNYVAQAFVAPSERVIRDAAAPLALKLDLRNYVYNGHVQLVAARLYQGQTTNFRTPGGGFAPVFTDCGTSSPPEQQAASSDSMNGR